MTTITIPAFDAAARPTRLEAALLAGAAAVQRTIGARMLRRAERSIARSAADRHAEQTREHALTHLARHPRV
ncbi:hypothetical protein KZX37_13065 [Microbacterium sp. EYE_5]|uniref:hypothetical protein n=1 Tax=unclassified Microbacterium TaxID=2609290 RepID=UPI002002DA25|nr:MULTISPECIES: hypothetical protein [unclassified Microbacterium]MCK6080562.1 hypothetical protein [Microbacterium sp. EYE_382]MCK6085833.1 hypothetical protein [Microbacterium sp. EYE_384]MCK6124669.1 hypothetical protein [Microbacterium sp. EYE_80]MCK6127578.1 hypothetical protein [Microbacterium sp. EYE_79]MCK6141517.1 hypothetical protein [Microbacterium sp. EYE_39]